MIKLFFIRKSHQHAGIKRLSIFVVAGGYSHVCFLYERVEMPNILSCFLVGRPRPEYGLPVAVIRK